MNWRLALPFVLIALLLVGCVGKQAGVKYGLKQKSYANIVSLSPSTTEILSAVGGAHFLVGRTANCDRPGSIESVPIVADIYPDYEAIMATEPNLIIYDTMLYSDDEIAKIEDLGVETLAYDADTIDEFADFGYRLAAKLSIEMFMSSHMDKIYRAVAAARAEPTGDPRTTIMLGADGGGDYLVMGDSGIHSALIESAGGKVIGVKGRLFQQMSIEKLIEADPEVIFTDGVAIQVLKDPRLQGITAVKEKHVYDVGPRTLVRIGGNMNELITSMHKFITVKPTAKIEETA